MTIIAVQAITLEELLAAHRSAVNALPFDTLLDCFGDLAKTVSRRARQSTERTEAKCRSSRTMSRRASAGSAPSPMATAEITDEALLTAYIDGDRQAFAALLERYRTELHGFLARFLGSSAAADDVFQDIMESKAEVPDSLLESAETRERVKDVVDSMPALYREVLQLNYFQKMSYQQIAEVLGVPLGTVKSRLHAAVATFAESWKTADARSLRTSSANKESKA